jgi:hypothetical protein
LTSPYQEVGFLANEEPGKKMNENIRSLIAWWKLRAKKQTDPFIRFFLFYICFEAWLTSESDSDKFEKKLKWLLSTQNILMDTVSDFWKSPSNQAALTALKSLSPIYDTRPGSTKSVSVNDVNNIEEVVRAIYQVRCNFFHGTKDPHNPRDSNLVQCTGDILEKWITYATLKF